MKIQKAFEKEHIIKYLKERKLLKQYQKAKLFLLAGLNTKINFKQRHPKESGIWCFRINKQFRAFCVLDQENNIIVFKIDNHQ